jgi:uncharacterized protein YkwD
MIERKSCTVRSLLNRTALLFVETLESRRLLSVSAPTAQEQYVVELINRGRLAPAAEAARYQTDLNEGLPGGTINPQAKQPLAINPSLMDSARGHTQWMLDTQTFSHTGVNGASPDQRMIAAGYPLVAPFEWAENIAWQSQSESQQNTTATLDAIHQNLYVDSSEPDRGHRLNLMDPNLKEIGVGVQVGSFVGYNAVMETEDYAFTGTQSFLTGVAFRDTVLVDHFYTPGEGLGGIAITATRASDGAVFKTSTWDSGGYSLALPAGTYTVRALGASLNGTVTDSNIVVGDQNVKVDFNPLPAGGTSGTSGGTGQPTAALNRHRYAYTSANGHYFCFAVTYTGTNPLVQSSLGSLTVSGPNRFAGQAMLSTVQSFNGGNTLMAIYYVRRSRGSWGSADLGAYTIKLPANQARDNLNDIVSAATLGALRLVLSA